MGKMKVACNENLKKLALVLVNLFGTWVFFLYKYKKFWSISSEFKLERKTFILEVYIYAKQEINISLFELNVPDNWLVSYQMTAKWPKILSIVIWSSNG